MRLIRIKLRNFRCYRNETIVNFNDLTALVGKNDAGKSTILEALEIFFNNKNPSLEQEDLNVYAKTEGETDISITCEFDELPENLVIDATAPTSLEQEYLLNTEGHLEVKKVFKCSAKRPSETVFIVANHPTAPQYNDLLTLTQANLKKRLNDLNIEGEVNRTINSDMRRATWENTEELNLATTDIPVKEQDAKKVWDQLKKYLPLYALFQSDRKSKDDDKEVADPMKIAIDAALKDVEERLQEINDHVRTHVMDVAQRTLEKLREMNPEIANELHPILKDPSWGSVFKLTLSGDNGIPINKRGSGVRRLVLLNFFRAEAERRRVESETSSIIFAFEEPETSQHPDHQRVLIEAFKELAQAPHAQVFLTTHTPALAGLIQDKDLRLVTTNDGQVVVRQDTETILPTIAETLGVLPNVDGVRLVFCVEGPNDVEFFHRVSQKYQAHDNTLPNLAEDQRVITIPLGGSTLQQWVDRGYLNKFNIPQYHIYDSDGETPPKYAAQVQTIIDLGPPNHARSTTRRETENYISVDAINRVLEIQINNYGDNDDVPLLVAEATHNNAGAGAKPWAEVDQDGIKKKVSRAKYRLNTDVVEDMTLDELRAADNNEEVLSWLREIRDRITDQP